MTTSEHGTSGVQSVARAFALLEVMAEACGELSVSELAAATGLPLPTIHRLVRTLQELGQVHQLTNRRYTLGPRLVGLGERASRMLGLRAAEGLKALAEAVGETANLAVLDSDRAVYTAQAPSPRHAMRMFSEIGRRVPLHSTGVGKALLVQLPAETVRRLLGSAGTPRLTAHTMTGIEPLLAELAAARARGHAVDDSEHELGVFCVAVPVPGAPSPTALSVSGPTTRFSRDRAGEAAALLQAAAARMTGQFASPDPGPARRAASHSSDSGVPPSSRSTTSTRKLP